MKELDGGVGEDCAALAARNRRMRFARELLALGRGSQSQDQLDWLYICLTEAERGIKVFQADHNDPPAAAAARKRLMKEFLGVEEAGK